MPYIRPKQPAFAKVGRLMKGYGLTGRKVAEIIGCAGATGVKKLEDPELFTLGDLMRINKAAHIPADEIREAIQFNLN